MEETSLNVKCFSCSVDSIIMISQSNARETIAVLTTRGINLPESEKPLHRGQDILKKYLKAEIKVTGVNAIQTLLEWMEDKVCLGIGYPLKCGSFWVSQRVSRLTVSPKSH